MELSFNPFSMTTARGSGTFSMTIRWLLDAGRSFDFLY
jgi:hypothetical protein